MEKRQSDFLVELKAHQSVFLDFLMERIEHPEVAEIFERYRDFICDVENATKKIEVKIEREQFL